MQMSGPPVVARLGRKARMISSSGFFASSLRKKAISSQIAPTPKCREWCETMPGEPVCDAGANEIVSAVTLSMSRLR